MFKWIDRLCLGVKLIAIDGVSRLASPGFNYRAIQNKRYSPAKFSFPIFF